jgi:hypothetical protein
MPKIYRVMAKEADGGPLVEQSGKGLGVRDTGLAGGPDIVLDDAGIVVLNGEGMSVAPSLGAMLPILIPKRLKDKYPQARGSSGRYCFAMGQGPFVPSGVAAGLVLTVTSPKHGNVVPAHAVSLERFRSDIAATRSAWFVEE